MDKPYSTPDIYLSACLIILGHKLEDILIEDSAIGQTAVFLFETDNSLSLHIQAFKEDLLGTAEIPLRTRSAMRQVKLLKHKMYDMFKKKPKE